MYFFVFFDTKQTEMFLNTSEQITFINTTVNRRTEPLVGNYSGT